MASGTKPVSPVVLKRHRHDDQALRRLRTYWGITALVYVCVLAACFFGLRRLWDNEAAHGWLLWAAIMMVAELAIVLRGLPLNRRTPTSSLLPSLGYGTAVTLFCGLLLFLMAGFLFSAWPASPMAWAPALLYTTARILDLFDGYAARITDHVTELGAMLDIEFDGLGVLVAIIMGVSIGHLPIWYLPLSVSRQLFIAGIWLRRRWHQPVYELPPSDNRRIVAGFQTGFLSVALWPVLPPVALRLVAVFFATALLTSFVRDWLVVSAVLDATSSRYQRFRFPAKRWLEGWMPLMARIICTLLAIQILWPFGQTALEWQRQVSLHAFIDSDATLAMLVAFFVLAVFSFAGGIAGRVAALALVGLAMLDIAAFGLSWSGNSWLLLGAAFVAHFGSGFGSLWSPEEPFLHRRLGGE